MNYDRMTQLALRSVVRDAIRRVIREDGLPGAHHFYISFLTRFPGVDVDASLADKYKDEITIVLEHQYWDLKAHDDSFEVTLKFAGVPKYLSVPYTAITRFHDPSVGFAMQFDPPEEMSDTPIGTSGDTQRNEPVTLAKLRPETAPGPKAVVPAPKSQKKPAKMPGKKPTKKSVKAEKSSPKENGKKDDANKVVSLDAFRKK
ncbi:MAG: hypothetical protein COA91_09885 [Robiginitomaculum sp.]|nr:MAG: hypothetical protein COA91_09885 [Robiginitomaculum sp.]